MYVFLIKESKILSFNFAKVLIINFFSINKILSDLILLFIRIDPFDKSLLSIKILYSSAIKFEVIAQTKTSCLFLLYSLLEIITADANVRTDLVAPFDRLVYMQEINQTLGARNDFNLKESIFNDPPQGSNIGQYKKVDLDLGKILYKRPPGNKTLNGSQDYNPEDHQIR